MIRKRIFLIALLLIFCLAIFYFLLNKGINHKYIKENASNTTWESFTGIDIKYHDAYENCVSLLQNPKYFFNPDINTDKISLEIVEELDGEKIQLFDTVDREEVFSESDKEYLCFTIGEEFFCIKLVCNPETNKVIGYIKDGFYILERKYQKAYENCIFMLRKFNNEAPYIEKDKVSVDLLQNSERSKVQVFKDNGEKYLLEEDKEYLCFKIGEPEYCVKFVCNLKTDRVIGYIKNT